MHERRPASEHCHRAVLKLCMRNELWLRVVPWNAGSIGDLFARVDWRICIKQLNLDRLLVRV
jgi:hypothetical protein